MTASMPCAITASRMRSSSVATTTLLAPPARARSATRTTMGLPPMSESGLPGSLVEAYRAGMRTVNTWLCGVRVPAWLLSHSYSEGSSRRASSSSMTGMPSRMGYASRADLETSSCRVRSNISGPLVTGHTRISSNLGSTQLLLDERKQLRINDRPDRERPTAVIGERGAFYRILLGHQDRRCIRQREVLSRESMVVRIRVTGRRDTQRFQVIEKSLRIADACERVHTRPAESLCAGALAARTDTKKPVTDERHRKFAAERASHRAAEQHDGVGLAQARARLAQRPGG